MITENYRLGWIDYAKVIGIFLIVFGHMPINAGLISFLWTFHVPLFFFISGFLYKGSAPKDFIIKKIKRIFLPYMYIYLLSVLYVVITRPEHNIQNIFNMSIGFLWGTHSYPFYINVPLWFLASLFSIELVFHFIIKKYPLLFPLFLIMSVEFYAKGYVNLFFSADLSLLGLNYFIIGYLFKKYGLEDKFRDSIIKLTVLVTVLFTCTLIYVNYQNVWYGGKFYLVSLSGGVVGIFMIIYLSQLLDKIFGQLKIISFYSKNTILILGFHMFLMPYSYSIVLKCGITSQITNSALASLLSILLLTPAIFIISRYIPALAGSQKTKEKPYNLDNS